MENEGNPTPEQDHTTPQDLNGQLTQLFTMILVKELKERTSLPQPEINKKEYVTYEYSDDPDEWPEDGFEEVYTAKLKRLLNRAPITQHFRSVIQSNMEIGIFMGIYEPDYDEELQGNYFFIRQDDASGGIFDKEIACGIERQAIALETVKLINKDEQLEKLRNESIIDEEKHLKIMKQLQRNDQEKAKIKDWIEEFKQTYGEDIIS